MSKFYPFGSLPYRNYLVIRSRLISSLSSMGLSHSCYSVFFNVFYEVDFLRPSLDRSLLSLSDSLMFKAFQLSDRYNSVSPKLMGKLGILKSYSNIYCFLFDIVTPFNCFPLFLEDVYDCSFSYGNISPSKY